MCGYETITLTTAGTDEFSQLDLAGASFLEIDLASLFENSCITGLCPITEYKLVTGENSNTDIDPSLFDKVFLDAGTLKVSEFTPTMTFAVRARSLGGSEAWKVISIAFDGCNSQQVAALISVYNLNLTKDQGVVLAIAYEDVTANFITILPDTCPITDFAFTFTPGPDGFPFSLHNPDLPTDLSIYVDTDLNGNAYEYTNLQDAVVTASTDAGKSASFTVNFTVGCFGETAI